MENEKNQQELMFKLSMYEQQIKQIQENMEMVEQNIIELSTLNLGLDDLKGKKDSEILSPVGRGIFVKSKLIDENLIVDVGSKKFVTKSIDEAKDVIKNQLKKLEEIRDSLNFSLEKINEEIGQFLSGVEKDSKSLKDN
ncbi:prefoldin subunit alpha [Candidatus Pacearchaeota archaeon CG10_big_fil_rev_8_21_14_0_10_32_14]|nr:MAG: prefoldin subunit alpha [Candidatus Pacearchaeota archaeon CG10_big_fil_rev_8_21_14_0_10_32_14]